MDDEIAAFIGISNASEEAARYVLDMCAGDLGQAIQLWYSDEELQRSFANPAAVAAAAAAPSNSRTPPPVPHSTRPRGTIGHEDASGVIHIDSDDDDDLDMLDDDATDPAAVAARAQEEEDAAMAKRLQEELYGGGGGAGPAAEDDGVRAPIARVTETLVAPGGGGPWPEDDEEDMHAQMLEQMRRRRAQPRKTNSTRCVPHLLTKSDNSTTTR